MRRTVAQGGPRSDLAWLGEAHEAALRRDPDRRRRLGAFMTPPPLASEVVRRALDAWNAGRRAGSIPVVLDPACGSGNLLVEAARWMVTRRVPTRRVAACLRGMDVDRGAVQVTRRRLVAMLGGGADVARSLARGIRVGDATRATTSGLACDVLVANPPFLGQLKRHTAVDRATASRWRRRFGEAVGGYLDPAGIFLLLGVQSLTPGGVSAVILPRSILAAQSAEAVRASIDAIASLEAVWLDDGVVFEAGTRVCVLHLRRRQRKASVVEPPLEVLGSVRATLPWPLWQGRWSAAAAAGAGVPPVQVQAEGVVGDLARVTADFRDQFYGLQGTLCDDRHAGRGLNAVRPRTAGIDRAASRMDRLPILTTGLIAWNRSLWGLRPARLLGRALQHPAARVPALLRNPAMRAWLSDALHPKVLVATQTPVVEAVVDPMGEVAGGVPVIRVVPHEASDLWLLAAALLAPSTSAVAWWRHAGAGLSPAAIKLSARQVAALPLPADGPAWRQAARCLQRCHASRGDAELARSMQAFERASARAYGLDVRLAKDLTRWWRPLAWHTLEGP
jgi:hypothetical protein